MTLPAAAAVVVDTGVFGAQFGPRSSELAFAYRAILADRPLIVSFVTEAELRFGATLANWGDKRLGRLDDALAGVDTVWPSAALVSEYAALRTWCVREGHGLGQKEHEADRWVAATALWLGIPLVSHDAFSGAWTGWSC